MNYDTIVSRFSAFLCIVSMRSLYPYKRRARSFDPAAFKGKLEKRLPSSFFLRISSRFVYISRHRVSVSSLRFYKLRETICRICRDYAERLEFSNRSLSDFRNYKTILEKTSTYAYWKSLESPNIFLFLLYPPFPSEDNRKKKTEKGFWSFKETMDT